MKTRFVRFESSLGRSEFFRLGPGAAVCLTTICLFMARASATDLKVMTMGLGAGSVTSSPAGISCGADCDESFSGATAVTLTATPAPGSTFSHWEGDGSGTSNSTTVSMDTDRSVRAVFNLSTPIPQISNFTPAGIQSYLAANPSVNTPGRFVVALPEEFKTNWLLMTRSESLQTGIAESPRLLLPSANAQFVFTVGLTTHASYPGSHPNAIEYMQWDGGEKNFRFHEIVLDPIPAMGAFPARSRGISVDDNKCSKCHSTRNVLNNSSFAGTTGLPPGSVKFKNKPNWDTYDSWSGLMPLNRDRIYQGSVEAAAFRKLLDFWTWRSNDTIRPIIEQLKLQPPGVPVAHVITRSNGGTFDGHINFPFDVAPPVLVEPAPTSSGTGGETSITTNYSFDSQPGTGTATSVTRGGSFVTLHHSNIPTSDEGRGVRLFDALGGLAGTLNQQRISDELISHRFATGNVPVEIRPIALAIAKGLLSIDSATNTVRSNVTGAPLTVDLAFFNSRNGMNINELVNDTRTRAYSMPRRKADFQKLNLHRTGDVYLAFSAPAAGLIQQYGDATTAGADTSLGRLRQEVFRRPIDAGFADRTVMGGIYVDRELANNIETVALFRYFLEPFGVSVDKWSMGVRGRSRTYTFADVFGTYTNEFVGALRSSLLSSPVSGLSNPDDNPQLIAAVNSTLSSLPAYGAVPTYTDVQRIFNKSCIECHGGLDYPPYSNSGSAFVDFSEDENPTVIVPPINSRLFRSNSRTMAFTTPDPATSRIYQLITRMNENCSVPLGPNQLMPCGGPALSKADVETIRRWITGPPSRPFTHGDPHIRTIEGVNYDFQAVGEFVQLRGIDLEIQSRHTAVSTDGPLGPNAHTGLTTCVSINSAVAVRVGEQRITYQPDLSGKPDPDGLQLRVDGELAKLDERGIPLKSGGRVIRTIAPNGIQIEVPGGAVVIVTPGWWEHYQIWYLNIDARNVRATEGLMGSITPGNWLPALPDGTQLGSQPASLGDRYDILYKKFGEAWRVTDETTLFDYAPGTSTKTFTVESWPGGESAGQCVAPVLPSGPAAKPPQKRLPLEVASEVCSGIVDGDRRSNCIQDVMATGERGFAKTYLMADQIDRNVLPAAPKLVFPKDDVVGLTSPITFSWDQSIDLDGDPISYRHYVWPIDDMPDNNRADFVPKSSSKTISRTYSKLKSGKSYFWKVIADDGKGGTVESEIRRFQMK